MPCAGKHRAVYIVIPQKALNIPHEQGDIEPPLGLARLRAYRREIFSHLHFVQPQIRRDRGRRDALLMAILRSEIV